MPTFDEIQVTTLLAFTDPNSPYFLKELMELRNLDIKKEYDTKIIDRTILAILNVVKLDEKLLVNEQLKRAVETQSKYLQDYAAYQEAVHKQALDDLKLDPKQKIVYLTEQNSNLEKELKALTAMLETVEIDQAKISEKWGEMQKKSGEEFAEKLVGKSITTLDGKQIVLDEKKIEQLQDKVFNSTSNDPNRLMQIIPSLGATNPADVEIFATKMEHTRMLNIGFNALGGIRAVAGMKLPDNANLSPKEFKEFMKLNTEVMQNAIAAAQKYSGVARGLQAERLKTDVTYIKNEMGQLGKQININSHEIEQAEKAEKGVDKKASPFDLSAPKPPGTVAK